MTEPRTATKSGGSHGSHERDRAGGGRLLHTVRLLARTPEDEETHRQECCDGTGDHRRLSSAAAAGDGPDGERARRRPCRADEAKAPREPPGGPAHWLPILNRH